MRGGHARKQERKKERKEETRKRKRTRERKKITRKKERKKRNRKIERKKERRMVPHAFLGGWGLGRLVVWKGGGTTNGLGWPVLGCPGNSTVAYLVMQHRDLGYGERRCGLNTKHQSTMARTSPAETRALSSVKNLETVMWRFTSQKRCGHTTTWQKCGAVPRRACV